MPIWNQYEDKDGNYVPEQVVQQAIEDATKAAKARFVLKECYAEQLPEDSVYSHPGQIRRERSEYKGAWFKEGRQLVKVDVYGDGSVTKMKSE